MKTENFSKGECRLRALNVSSLSRMQDDAKSIKNRSYNLVPTIMMTNKSKLK